MARNKPNVVGSRSALVATMAAMMALAWPSTGSGQDQPPDQAEHDHQHPAAAKPTETGDSLPDQVRQLRANVSKLEAALSKGQGAGQSSPMDSGQTMDMRAKAGEKHSGQSARVAAKFQNCVQCHQTRPSGPLPPSHLEKAGNSDQGSPNGGGKPGMSMGKTGGGMGTAKKGGMGMGMMGGEMGQGGMGTAKKGGMGMMGGEMGPGTMGQGGQGMGGGMGMKGGGGGGMEKMEGVGMMGMGAMGKAKRMGMSNMKTATSLPGFPGISHLYHIGAEGFFLNHDEHITLSADQRKKLNQIKQKALLGGSSYERKAEEAEQELWELTASDAPDAAAIEAKVREIAKHQGDQRLSFIRAVGEAAKVLTDKQRAALTDATSDAAAPATTSP
jgi:Spy/CpxP family protein refolding chaperone